MKSRRERASRREGSSVFTLAERSRRAGERAARAREAADEMRRAAAEGLEGLERAGAEVAAAEGRGRELDGRLAELAEREAGAQGERAARELERERALTRIEALRDRERELEALESGARALLEGVERGDGPCSPGELLGLVADHLRADTRLARALDAALGSAAQAIVARDAGLVGDLIRWLETTRSGQARVVAPAGMAPQTEGAFRPLSGFAEPELSLIQGRLVEQVECAPELEPLARLLIGDVLLVEELGTALRLAAAHARWRYVTPAGDLVDAAGVLGGHREIAQGPVGRRATADELERGLEEIGAALARAEGELERVAAERERAAAELAEARAALETARTELAQATSAAQTAEARLADLEGARAAVEEENTRSAAELEQLARDIAAAEAELAASEADFDRENAALSGAEESRGELEQRVEVLQRETARREVDLSRSGAEREGLMERISDLGRVLREARVELERARRLVTEHTESAEGGEEEALAVQLQGDQLLQERGLAERRLGELRATERSGREAIETFRRRVDAASRELEDLGAEISERRLEEQRVRLVREELGVRAREDLGSSEAELLDGFVPEEELRSEEALAALDAEVADLKGRLDDLGAVNTDAVDELDEAAERFDFLTRQREDLARSSRALREAIGRIDAESERLFQETFEEVRGHFQTLFRQLFGGGRADLVLGEGESVLEAGIEITARPPGREMLPIGLLSGGQRTLTALALLFAVFRSRPSPFCVLDEVDAALDDANIGRFLGMLDTFRETTQFVVVTHNKGTMAACERMYGITMETKGVSTHVSVEFGEVDAFVPEATGDADEAGRSRGESRPQGGEGPPVDESYEIPGPAPSVSTARTPG